MKKTIAKKSPAKKAAKKSPAKKAAKKATAKKTTTKKAAVHPHYRSIGHFGKEVQEFLARFPFLSSIISHNLYTTPSMALYPELSSVLYGSPNAVYQGFATLNLCPDVTDFTNLLSQYRITEVEYHIINSNYTGVEISQGTGM